MMQTIDFSTIYGIHDKMSADEIQKLNEVFQSLEVVTRMEEAEAFRRKRQHIFGYVTLFIVIGIFLWGYFFGKIASIVMGMILIIFLVKIFFHMKKNNNYFITIEKIWILATFFFWKSYQVFRSKIEIPLKENIMNRVCKTLHSSFEYSSDAKYSFDNLTMLKEKWFLNSYTHLDGVEDSCALKIEQDGKSFLLNGFKLKTSEMKTTWNRKIKVITNHDYLLKIVFPHALIPLLSDIIIGKDTNESRFILFRFLWWFQKKRVVLEDVDFEKIYDVHCDDEISSRMILTPVFIEKLLHLTKKTGNQYSFFLSDNVVYIKRKIIKKYIEVGLQKNMFENVKGFLDFYIDMREALLFIWELYFLYDAQTKEKVHALYVPENVPVSFIEPQGFSELFWFSKKQLPSST